MWICKKCGNNEFLLYEKKSKIGEFDIKGNIYEIKEYLYQVPICSKCGRKSKTGIGEIAYWKGEKVRNE